MRVKFVKCTQVITKIESRPNRCKNIDKIPRWKYRAISIETHNHRRDPNKRIRRCRRTGGCTDVVPPEINNKNFKGTTVFLLYRTPLFREFTALLLLYFHTGGRCVSGDPCGVGEQPWRGRARSNPGVFVSDAYPRPSTKTDRVTRKFARCLRRQMCRIGVPRPLCLPVKCRFPASVPCENVCVLVVVAADAVLVNDNRRPNKY